MFGKISADVKTPLSGMVIADIFAVTLVTLLALGLGQFIRSGNSQFAASIPIDPDFWALPQYAVLSLVRGLIALGFSLVLAVTLGGFAARNETTEKFLIPIIDVLQSLPVLTFLPGVLLALTTFFHNSRWGIELTCVAMIITGQVWNLIFAYYQSQKTIMPELKSVSKMCGLTPFQRFIILDLPNGLRPLIYNGMMAMAGGWFFITLCEAFVLGEKSFRLPGLGSYLSVCFESGNYKNFMIGIMVLFFLIYSINSVLWKPLIAWSTRFDDSIQAGREDSWVYDLMRRTHVPSVLISLEKMILRISHLLPFRGSMHFQVLKKAGADGWTVIADSGRVLHNLLLLRREGRPSWNRSIVRILLTMVAGSTAFFILTALPTIGRVISTLTQEHWLDLIRAFFHTASKVMVAMVVSTLWTLPLCIWIGKYKRLSSYFLVVSQNLAAFPAPVLFPLVTLLCYKASMPAWFVATLLMTIGNQWYLLFNVLSGVTQIPQDLMHVCKMHQISWVGRWTKLYLPAMFPSLVTGWITLAGGAWNASIVAEIVDFPGGTLHAAGIGALITQATAKGDYPRLVGAVVVITIGLVLINRAFWRTLHILSERYVSN